MVIIWLSCLALIIGVLFWRNELKYQLPTPVPLDYKQVSFGSFIDLPFAANKKPVFIHFFNPDCPCSRFNMKYFRALVRDYSDRINFMIVPMAEDGWTAEKIQKKFGLSIPVIKNAQIAEQCGVYSTPQAVILDEEQHLYYRGNYNRSRYCTDPKTAYAKNALDAFLNREQKTFEPMALKAYGCELPTCNK